MWHKVSLSKTDWSFVLEPENYMYIWILRTTLRLIDPDLNRKRKRRNIDQARRVQARILDTPRSKKCSFPDRSIPALQHDVVRGHRSKRAIFNSVAGFKVGDSRSLYLVLHLIFWAVITSGSYFAVRTIWPVRRTLLSFIRSPLAPKMAPAAPYFSVRKHSSDMTSSYPCRPHCSL